MGFIDIIKNIFDSANKELINVSISTGVNSRTLSTSVPKEIREAYRKTLFLYAESKISKIKPRDKYVGYLNYECGITNPDLYHKQLISEGYFELAPNELKLEKYKVSELKKILTDKGISAKGKKDDLIKLLVDNSLVNEIPGIQEECYILSDKRKKFFRGKSKFCGNT